MTINVKDEIEKTRMRYRQKKTGAPISIEEGQHKPSFNFSKYMSIFLNIMKRDIMIKLGVEEYKKRERMKQEYNDFMERFGK